MSLDAELIINLLPVFFFPEYFSITPHDPWPVCVKVQTQTLYQCNWHVHVISVYSTLIKGLIKDCSIFSPQIDTEFSVHIYIVPLHLI